MLMELFFNFNQLRAGVSAAEDFNLAFGEVEMFSEEFDNCDICLIVMWPGVRPNGNFVANNCQFFLRATGLNLNRKNHTTRALSVTIGPRRINMSIMTFDSYI